MWSEVRLAGWTGKRRIIILRRPLREDLVAAKRKSKGRRRKAQMELEMGWVQKGTVLYEDAVLVTSLEDEIFTLAQHYRDRGDAENNFDELKNQWGWLGFTTPDHARSEMMTLFVAVSLQLVEPVHAAVNSSQTRRSDYLAPAVASRHRTQDQSQ
jgi:hypothetical protein